LKSKELKVMYKKKFSKFGKHYFSRNKEVIDNSLMKNVSKKMVK